MKVRVNKNLHRAIVLVKARGFWVFQYLFAKQDQANITDAELLQFRELAKTYAHLTDAQLASMLRDHDFVEVTHAHEDPLQE